MRPAPALPTGTATFLFTDIEGSARLLQQFPDEYPGLLSEHDLQAAVESGLAMTVEQAVEYALIPTPLTNPR